MEKSVAHIKGKGFTIVEKTKHLRFHTRVQEIKEHGERAG